MRLSDKPTSRTGRASADTELRDLFADEPELLALADMVQQSRGAVRRARGRSAALALAAAVVLVAAPVSLALGDGVFGLFEGAPATHAVKAQYLMLNGSLTKAAASAFAVTPAEVSKAHGVAEIETVAGPVYLWTAPETDGGSCYLVQFADEPPSDLVGGGCYAPTAPNGGNMVVGSFPSARHPSLQILYGYTFGHATTVKLVLIGKPSLVLPTIQRYFLAAISERTHVRYVISYDAQGVQVGEAVPGHSAST